MSDQQTQRIRRKFGLEKYPAILGDTNGVIEDDPIRRPGMVRVRYSTAAGLSLPPIVSIGNYQGQMRPGTCVWVGWQDNQLCLLRPNLDALVAAGFNPSFGNGADERLKRQQSDPLNNAFRSHPTSPASAYVVVRSLLYLNGTTWVLFDASEDDGSGGYKGKIDLTSYISAAGNHRLICLFLKKSDNTIEVKASTAKSILDPLGLTDLQECLTAASANVKPCWAWKSADAKATFDDSDSWLDLRQIVNDSDYASSAYLPLAGGTMAGNINLNDNALLKVLYTDYKSAAAPANPSAGYVRVYVDTADGHTKQRDSAGSVTDLASSGGGATVDMTGTAGENLSARDAVYLNPSDNQWYKIDIDATATVKVAKFRGLATAAINSAATGTIRLAGALTGFTSLTAGADVYASTTAGGYTQTKPTVSAAGGQRAIVRLGFADSTTSVVVEKSSVVFAKRESLANAATLTIEHYADPLARERLVRAYISVTSPVVLTSYATTNQDTEVELRGRSGAGGTTTITASGTFLGIGTAAGSTYRVGQSFQVTAGILSQFTVAWGASTGTPTGTVTWSIQTDNAGIPSGTALATGTFTPTASSTDTISVSSGPFLAASTTYWLCIQSTTPQTGDNYWHWQAQTPGTYANGQAKQDANSAGTWSNQAADYDAQCSITTSAITSYDKLAQSFQIGSTSTCDKVRLYLRKYGSPTGTMTLRIETDSAGAPSGTLVDANATVDVAESGLGTSLALVSFDFATNFSLTGSTSYWLVLSTDRAQSDTNYIVWGADGSSPSYADGAMDGYASSAWGALSKDAIFYVDGPDTTYEAPKLVDDWSSSLAVILARFDDGVGANGDTNSTVKNGTGATIDVTAEVILP